MNIQGKFRQEDCSFASQVFSLFPMLSFTPFTHAHSLLSCSLLSLCSSYLRDFSLFMLLFSTQPPPPNHCSVFADPPALSFLQPMCLRRLISHHHHQCLDSMGIFLVAAHYPISSAVINIFFILLTSLSWLNCLSSSLLCCHCSLCSPLAQPLNHNKAPVTTSHLWLPSGESPIWYSL